MSDKFDRWMRENHPNFSPTLLEVWNAALSSLQGEQEAKIAEQEAEILRLRSENETLYTTMMAAAVEIHEHWDTHCDSEGYGPSNLMHRLERGIASRYGYDAKTVVDMQAKIAEQEARIKELEAKPAEVEKDAERLDYLSNVDLTYRVLIQSQPSGNYVFDSCIVSGLRAAIDAAIQESKKGGAV